MEKQNDQKIKSKIDIKKGKAKNVELPSQQSRIDSKQQAVSILQLFRFATKLDYLFMILGLLGAIVAACAMPIFQILWAIATLQFRDSENAVDTLIKFIYFGAILFIGIITMMFFWGKTGHRQTQKCKRAYFNSLLKKKVSWYDINDHNRIISSFSRQISAYKAAVSNKVAILCLTIASFFTKTGVGLYYGWYLTLMLLIGFPLLVISSLLFRRFEQKKTKVQLNQYSKADARCQQAIGNIETVKILNGENYQVQRYKRLLQLAEEKTLKYGYINGVNLGLLSFLVITMYAWGFYYGSLLLQNNVYNPNSITGDYLYNAGIIVSLTNLITVQIYQVIQFYPTLNYIQQAKVAARKIYNIIDDVQNNETIQQNAIIPNQFNAKIRFHEVTFAYPKNKNKKILDKVSFQINQNTVAIIGQSGCGKSTIFQLLTRLYQPDQGKIYIDQIDIKLINLSWLRNQISFVIQQPPLHFGTIRDNMLFANPQASQQDMINSLQIAEAWNFVNQYKQKLDTNIGQGGSLLSGGQKQRVAIAQALVKKPKILLMDQATSALDKRNQQIIQARILNLNNRPKILFIAHRQTTIRSASTFILIENMKANKINISQIKELQNFQEFPQTLFIQKKQSKQLKNNQESKRKFSSQKEAGFLQLVHRNNFKSGFGKQKSQTQSELYNQAPQQQQKEEEVSMIKRLLAYSMKQKKAMFVSFFAILATVAMYPMFGIFIGKAIAILLLFPSNQIQFRSSINGVVLAIFLIAIGAFISKAVEHSCFSYIGSKITKQIRIDTYNKIMRMPLQNFDSYSLNKGTVSSLFSYRLSIDALRLNSLTTSHIGILMEVALILITGFTISIIFQYRIGCLMLGFLPFIFFFSFLQMSFNDQKNQGVLQNSILSQALNNIKMVYAYNRQTKFQSQLNDAIRLSQKGSLRGIIISSLLFGLSQYSIFIFFGLILFISIQIFSASPQTSVENVLIAIFSCWIGALSAGTQFYYIPDAVKAQKSAKNIFQILSQQDEDQKQIRQGSQMINEIDIKSIVFKDVFFSYSSEKTDRMILQNFSLQIYKRDYLTIVGQSGSGKSTFWKLILRLYDPLEGQVLINGLSAKQYDIHALRRKFGVVNQQPQLFNDNIMDNIKYSQKDTPVKQVFEVCKRVNAWNFILNKKEQKDTLQDSLQVLVNPVSKRGQQNDADLDQQQILKCFSRNLGSNGSHISGGQKQRIAIARALIRKPQVIILDQATSALDKINSMVAKKAIKDTRSINIKLEITHNLNSISGEQQVVMIHKGSIKEKGKKQVLKGKNGFFQKLTLGKKIISPF